MIKLIIGLGNPGKKYEKTRHNVGFMVLDALAEKSGVQFTLKKKLDTEIARIEPINRHATGQTFRLILAKPLTFMNNSGRAVQRLITSYKLQATSLLVVHDEIDLPFGKIKISQGSSSAGHKGVKSIIQTVGPEFLRLRVGVENRRHYRVPDTERYVLQNFTSEEQKQLEKNIIPAVVEEIKNALLPTKKRKALSDKQTLP